MISKKIFDFIIMGAGSAGCTLALKLSKKNYKIALLDAGTINRSWKVRMPAALTYNLFNDIYNWDYYTIPQKNLNNRKLHCPRGKMFGGSSSLNAMVYIEGHKEDYDRWENEGAIGFNYENIKKYFHDSDGPEVNIIPPNNFKQLFQIFGESGEKIGYPYLRNSDITQNNYLGFGLFPMTITNSGERASTYENLLQQKNRKYLKNIEIFDRSHFNQLIFDTTSKIKGLSYIKDNQIHNVYAKNTILSLGAIGSPHALMLSGIGDHSKLKQFDIPTIINLKSVGENLQDHTEVYVQAKCDYVNTLFPYGTNKSPLTKIQAGIEWFLNGTGNCASNHFNLGAFINSHSMVLHPDIQLHFIPGAINGQMDFLPYSAFQIQVGPLRPLSRGSIQLQSNNPIDPPLIDPNYYDYIEDFQVMASGIRQSLDIINQDPFQQINSKLLVPELETMNQHQLFNYIRENTHSAYHVSCSCPNGKVVDSQCNVYGTENLKIIDASVMPSMTSGNLNAPTIMIAKKIADDIIHSNL